MNIWYRIKSFIYNHLKGEFEPTATISKLNGWCFVVGKDHNVLFMSQSDSDVINWAMESAGGGTIKIKTGEYMMDKPVNIGVDGTIFDGEGMPTGNVKDYPFATMYYYPPKEMPK